MAYNKFNPGNPLPFLPGYRLEPPPKEYAKKHIFDVNQGIRQERGDLEGERGRIVMGASQQPPMATAGDLRASRMPMDGTGLMGQTMPAAVGLQKQPAWVAYDRKVLRFYCYFMERVVSSAVEVERARKCVLYFYLEDDSVHIAEPKIENSGIPQGVFIKRHRLPKADGQYIGLADLMIGADITVYGRTFFMIDCDDFTRSFYQSNGVEQSPGMPYPMDEFSKKHEPLVDHTHHKLMNPLKNFMEASLGKPMGIEIVATQKFLKNDGRVLRFFCTWEDGKMYGEKRPYILHYFLADDTVEVLEIQQANSGRDPFPALLKRQKLPKEFKEACPNVASIGVTKENNIRYYTEVDFRIGEVVKVYGRELLVCGCDQFTQAFYLENFPHLTPADFPQLSVDAPEKAVPRMGPPPYNGFGSEEDSLGSFLYLMPKVPKRDFHKLLNNDGKIMRFLGKFTYPQPADKARRFIIAYYLANDTIGVFEKFERNSGFIGGKFLERSRLKNVATGEYYKASDLEVGRAVIVNDFSFDLLAADDYTLKYIAENPQVFGETGSAKAAQDVRDHLGATASDWPAGEEVLAGAGAPLARRRSAAMGSRDEASF